MPKELRWMQEQLEQKYELMVELLGPDQGQKQEVRVLNRILRWTKDGVEYEVDPRHAEIIIDSIRFSICCQGGLQVHVKSR